MPWVHSAVAWIASACGSSQVPPALAREPGPSPWYLRLPSSRPFPDAGLEWREGKDGEFHLVSADGAVRMLVGMYVYVRPLPPGRLLAWFQEPAGSSADRCVSFHIFEAGALQAIPDPEKVARPAEGRPYVITAVGAGASARVPVALEAGQHRVEFPSDLDLEEFFALADSSSDREPPRVALWIVRPRQGLIEVLPQDWFNEGEFDFGYQWITRIARDPRSGRLVGEGIRLEPFRLDGSGRRLERWLARNPFTGS